MKSQRFSFWRVIVNFQTFTFLFQKKLQTESGNDIIQVINKNVGEVSLVNKNSLYFSLKKAIHTFRLKSIFCRILVVLVVLILGICSLFYLVISSHYRESSQEHEINGNLAALNLIGNQMEDQILKSETQLEELLDLNVLETLASQEDIFSNPAALDIVQKLKKLADENPLIARAFLYTEQWDALLSSDQTVKPLDDTEEASVVAYCRAQKMENTIAMFNGNLYLFCELPGGRRSVLGAIEINGDSWYQNFSENVTTFRPDFEIYPFLGDAPLFPDQIEYPDEQAFEVVNREVRNYGDEVCELPNAAGKLLAHSCSSVELHLLGFLDENEGALSLGAVLQDSFPALLPAFLLLVAAGIVLIVLICRPMWRTLQAILEQRNPEGSGSELATRGTKNEFELISSLFQEQKNHENRLSELLHKSSRAVTEQVLRDIIDGNEKNETVIRRTFSEIAAPFDCDLSYKIILAEVLREEEEDFSAVEAEISRIALRDLARNFWKEKAQCHILNHNDQRIVIVLGFPRELSVRNIRAWEEEFGELCISRFQNSPGTPVLGVSAVFSDVFSLDEAFVGAREELRKKLYYNTENKDPKDVRSVYKNKVHLCLERISREPEEAAQSMRLILQSTEKYPEEERQIWLDYIDEILEYLLRSQIPCEERWLEGRMAFTVEEGFAERKEQLKAWLEQFLENVVEKIMEQAGTAQVHYLEQAKNYIRNHYDDSNLSLLTVSENCSISRGYLSKLFAKYSDGSFTDYLNWYRVQQACELLKTTGFSVQEIGLKTGFNSPQSFSRVFKKHMNVTPSQYRVQKRRQGM